MSRIGKMPIVLPKGVEVKVTGQSIEVKGPKGTLKRSLHDTVTAAVEGGSLHLKLKGDTKYNRKFHGLSRSLVANMVKGVSDGFKRELTLIGVGYRAQMAGSNLTLTLGYSHPVVYPAPAGIQLAVDKLTTVIVSGADNEKVGQTAAEIRKFRAPEPYHGKGVRYSDEVIITKVGKSGSK